MTLSTRHFYLLLLSNIILICIGFFDIKFNSQELSAFLAGNINPNIYFLLIGFPHVFASFITMTHKGYLSYYKKYLLKVMAPILLVAIVLFFIDQNFYKILFCYLLATHIGGQLFGTIKIYGKRTLAGAYQWQLLNRILLFFSFLLMFAKDSLLYFSSGLVFFQSALTILATLSACAGLIIFLIDSQKSIKLFFIIFLACIQLAGIAYFSLNDNMIYWGLSITLLHDVTAFLFYINHEKNARKKGSANFLLPSILNSPFELIVTSILAAIFFTSLLSYLSLPYAMFLFQISHYLLEGKIWRNDSLHRQNITMDRP